MRKHYLDNLRNITILLLFPVHTFMIWNDFGTKFYVWGGENKILSSLIVLVNPWFMPLLFVIAGMSARYSLKKRSTKMFVQERIRKLLIPFISGMIFLVPIQTLYARKFFYGYEGGIIENLIYFFTHLTDFSGYDGGFTPGQLWFILFLFIISLFSLIVQRYLPYEKAWKKLKGLKNKESLQVLLVIGLFIPIWLFYYLGNFGGFSLGKNFALYLAGYYVLSNDAVIEKLEKNMRWIAPVYFITDIGLVAAYYQYSYYGDLAVNFIGWMGILTLLVSGKRYLNKETKFTRYFNKAAFPIYILHQSILVAIGYYVLAGVDGLISQVLIIMFGSFILSVLCCQIISWVPYLRKLVGLK